MDFSNTKIIQQCIDDISAKGGGTVTIPAGEFVTGNIELKNGVTLHLQKDAKLLGSIFRKDYNSYPKPTLIYAKNQQNIAITGVGTIDGRGRELIKDIFKSIENGALKANADWRITRPEEGSRTNLILLENCENIAIKGVTLKDATNWITHYEKCKNLNIDSVRIEGVAYWNNDGIDITDCKNVKITNSFINSADDAICLKSSTRGDFCDDIIVDNCTLRSSANAFKMGTASVGGFKNIKVSNIKVYDTFRSAIALEAVDGGIIENIEVNNVVATNTGNAIFIRLGHRNKDDVYSTVKNIHISNVDVTIPKGKPDKGYEMEAPLLMYPPSFVAESGKLQSVSPWNYKEKLPNVKLYEHNVFPSSITGLPDHRVENVVIENVKITYFTVADKAINYFPLDSFNQITEAEKDYPEFSMFGEVPAWGFYVRHVDGITLKNITLKMKGKDFRSAGLFNDVKQLKLVAIKTKGSIKKPALFFNDVVYAP
ncbi:glycoside hydrolase, family 28 [Arcticibacter svalbardensis MN12-7]|uniref:Glycoside hydrolase, family 28 n=1 Tax=Arcticibacter svalbardensis MN12-7 TaxID=1150600 RepID=R9GM59_9SPHI|nr:glycoside hydrolase, family 28 [Arcticibacter svalbardensis MN12-7]